MKFITKISLFILLFSSMKSFGQYDQAMLDSNYRFNVSFIYVGHNFYEGGPFLQFNNPFDKDSEHVQLLHRYRHGISFSFRISQRSTIAASYSFSGYSKDDRPYHERVKYGSKFSKGDLMTRGFKLYSIEYQYLFLRDIKINLDAVIGASYRKGGEYYFINQYYAYDTKIYGKALRDYGAYLGLSAYRDILKSRLRLSASLTHTEFFYRYDTGDKTDYEWDDGSNKRMLQFTFSIGYNFGQIPFKE